MEKAIISTNPSENYKEIGSVSVTTEEEIVQKIQRAKESQKKWKKYSLNERVTFLKELYELFDEKREILAKSLSEEMGMPIRQARDEVQYGMTYFLWYLENAHTFLSPEISYENEKELHTVFYEPKGVVVAIAPWNYPFSMMIWTCMQAIIAGNSVIFKTSKETILTGKLIDEIVNQSSLPKGVFNEIYGSGSTGDILVNQQGIDFITFTGSTKVGKGLAVKAASKGIGCVMELGGSAPGIVFADANIDEVIETIYFLRYSNSGQMCDGLKRLIVHRSRYEEVVQKLTEILGKKKLGVAINENTDIGPLVSETQLEALLVQYQDALTKGAKILYKGDITSDITGAYFPPVLLGNISFDMKVWNEEVFGPILPIVVFDTLEEAIHLANDTLYGLGAYIFTQDKELFRNVASSIESGMIQLNTLNYCIPANPFGGYKNSGIGREHGKWGFHEFCNIKVTSMYK